jgi:hypothetical protein
MSMRASAAKRCFEDGMPRLCYSYKKNSAAGIATKLAQPHELATQGGCKAEIARALRVSIMTLHRCRKTPPRVFGMHRNHETSKPERAQRGRTELRNSNSKIPGCGA